MDLSFMEEVLFGSITYGHLVYGALAVMVGLWVIRSLIQYFGTNTKSRYAIDGKCTHCRWTGKVSRYQGKAVCPKCGAPVRPL